MNQSDQMIKETKAPLQLHCTDFTFPKGQFIKLLCNSINSNKKEYNPGSLVEEKVCIQKRLVIRKPPNGQFPLTKPPNTLNFSHGWQFN